MSKKNLLIIGYTWPEPSTTAAGNRMLQLLRSFLEGGYQITFSSTATESERSLDVAAIGVQKVPIRLNHSSFDTFIKELAPDMVLFDRFLTEEQYGWRVAEFAPNALRILDTEDLHSLRTAREKAFKKNIDFTVDFWLQQDITKREIASIYRSDISMVISSYEMQLLKEETKIDDSLLLYLPFMVDPLSESKIDTLRSFEERKDFICIGNGKHAPNVDAVVWLKSKIWPLIREQLPNAKLNIYGAYLPQHVQEMHKPENGFCIEGWAENANRVIQEAKINLAPLRFGAGLKGKLVTAMENGTPSVTTTIGAEGMHDGMEFNGQIAETAESLAHAAIELYTDQKVWKQAQANGVEIINTLYDKSIWIEKLKAKITSVQMDLDTHRKNNFVGALLGHQTMSSTKYMAKWIAAKQKKA